MSDNVHYLAHYWHTIGTQTERAAVFVFSRSLSLAVLDSFSLVGVARFELTTT
jgi:hypothetical protein